MRESPMMAFIGVRISWLMLERNVLFAIEAALYSKALCLDERMRKKPTTSIAINSNTNMRLMSVFRLSISTIVVSMISTPATA